jgi:hypothetical protein
MNPKDEAAFLCACVCSFLCLCVGFPDPGTRDEKSKSGQPLEDGCGVGYLVVQRGDDIVCRMRIDETRNVPGATQDVARMQLDVRGTEYVLAIYSLPTD